MHTGVGLGRRRRAGGDGPVTVDPRRRHRDRRPTRSSSPSAAARRPATSASTPSASSPGRFVDVDDQLRATGVAGGWLYAVGDCNGRALLTHMGKYQARIAGDVILGKDAASVADHGVVPRVTFTDPQVCAVGLTEAEARDAGIDVRVGHATPPAGSPAPPCSATASPAPASSSSTRPAGSIVGATFTGPGVQELLHSATIAIAGEVTLDRLWHAVPSFPTVSEVWLRLLEEYGL